jgi:hypothetical protein
MNNKPGGNDRNNGWASAEVLQVVSEMKVPVSTTTSLLQSQQPFRSHSDPRLGSVWVVRIALSQYVKLAPPGGNKSNKSYDGGMSEFFQGGDLLLIQCQGLARYEGDVKRNEVGSMICCVLFV